MEQGLSARAILGHLGRQFSFTPRSAMHVLVVALLVFFARPVAAQDFGTQFDPQEWFKAACPKCGLRSSVDWIQNVPLPEGDRPVLAGWGFECVSGRAVDKVDANAWDPAQGKYVPVRTELRWQAIPRPDVLGSAPGCTVPMDSGFGAVIVGALPAGATSLKIVVWAGQTYHSAPTTIMILTR